MPGVTIRGVVATIEWAYYNAAAINGYTITRTETGQWSVRGTVVMADAYKMAQRPLYLLAPHRYGKWRWPIERFQLNEGRFTAALGVLEET
jgi:hypothetical protein